MKSKYFFTKQTCNLAAFFQNGKWLSKLCYLSDIFEKLNDLSCNILTSNNQVKSFVKKIIICKSMVEKDSYEMLSSIGNFVIEKNHCKTFIAKIIIDHSKALETRFQKYFVLNIDF